MNKQRSLPVLLCILFILSCSSHPPRATEVHSVKNRAAEYSTYGNTYYDNARYGQAYDFFRIALELNISVNNLEGMTENYNSLGKSLVSMGENEKGEASFIEAVATAQKTGSTALYVKSISNLSELYLRTGEIGRARAFIEEALEKIPELAGEEAVIAVLYHNAGVLHKIDSNTEQATVFFEKALAINRSQKQYREMAANYYMLASIRSLAGQYDEALSMAKNALDYDKKMENSYGIAKDIHALAIIHSKAGNTGDSYSYYQQAYLMYNSLRMRNELLSILETLVDLSLQYGTPAEQEQYKEDLDLLSGIKP